MEVIFAFLGLGLAAVLLGLLVARRSNAAALVLYFLAAGVAGLVVAFFVAVFVTIRNL